ncbi:MAG: M1 family peptidase, partial [Bacteroidota bacterium]
MYRRNLFSNLTLITLLITVFSCKSSKNTTRQVDLPEIDVSSDASLDVYREAYPQYVDLIHTELHLKPDWQKSEMEGTAVIRFKPHFYPTDSFVFDAKVMDIQAVTLKGQDSVRYDYDDRQLKVFSRKKHLNTDTLELTIHYTSRPEKMDGAGSFAIQGDKGLYFINPDGSNRYKPRQLWTQGETESNSVWFPTIESPAQKMTQDIFLTVDSTLQTVSNGKLISQKNNGDSTRTDHWRQSLPAAPYLTMIAAGTFSITKEKWQGIDVSYYVDPPYGKYAPLIFGETPSMLSFFSERFGVKYPWE